MEEGASSVRSNTKKRRKLDGDRISFLPESILHHILSFLDMKEVVQTSLIAKSWKYLWISVPNLNFCSSMWNKSKKKKNGKECKDGFVKFVDKVLYFRDNSNIRKFSCSRYDNADQISVWMTVAVRRRVEEISVYIYPDKPYAVPQFIFTSALVTFKVKSNTRHKNPVQVVQLPSSVSFASQLKILQLESVKLTASNSEGEFVLCCPLLEELTIEDCDHGDLNVLDIRTPQLKNLVIKMWNSCYCKIKMCTPNLTSLLLKGNLYDDYSLGNLSSLVSAKIELLRSPMDLEPLIGVLKCLHNATDVALSGWSLEPREIYFEWPQDVPIQLSHPFVNLRCLKLTGWNDSSCIHAIADVLKSSTGIETIVLEASQVRGSEGCREDLFNHTFHSLRSFELRNIEGSEIELRFVETLLKNAVMLESLTITTGESYTWKRTKSELVRFSRKIQSVSAATSSKPAVLVLFGD